MKKSPLSLANVKLSILLFGFIFPTNLLGQESLESSFRMSGVEITGAFETQREAIQKCSAVLYNGRKEIVYGVVISANGYFLSKASEIEGVEDLRVRIDQKSFKEVKIVAVDKAWDVALLKVDVAGLTPADFAPDSKLKQGTWVVVNGATSLFKRRVLVGIISAKSREIPAKGGAVLGVTLKKGGTRLEIEAVTEGSGAAEAGVLASDIITALDGEKVSNMEGVSKALEEKKVGDEVKISIERGDEKLELKAKLSPRDEFFQELDRNDMMSGDFSKRRSGFPRVLQHDILANSATMGGPVLDLKGRTVGMNIARANRAETFAIPVEELRELSKAMMEEAEK